MRKKTLLYSLLKPLAMAAVAILPLNTVHAQSTPSITTVTEELKSALSDAISFAAHEYQYTNTNSVDVFAGYFTVNRSTFQYGGPLPFTYSWPNDYYSSAGSIGPTAELYNAYTFAEQLGYPEYKAIAQIVYGMTALRATNVKGAISYIDSRNLKPTRPLTYQSQQEAYEMILADLDEAIATLETEQPDAATLQAIEGNDLAQGTATAAYSGYNWRNWVKLANTVKLRLAMCLAKPDPELARQIATEALSGTGVLDDDFGPTWISGTDIHPAYFISASKDGWADARMNASIENAMKRLGNPLIEVFFTTNSGRINDKITGVSMLAAGKDYVGIRQGVSMEIKTQGAGYYNFSEVSPSVKFIRPTWVCKEEVLFLKAEAALRWGIGGSAQQYYEAGIRAVFNRYGVSAGLDEYLARTETVKDKNGNEIDYIDYYVGENSCPGRIEIGVAWNDGDSDETKLEKIITQKWIAMFPNGGYEAWTDFRRTGYPRLLPVPEENPWTGTPSFPVELQIRRIPNIYSTDYDFSLEKNYIGLDIYDEPQYINLTKKEGVSLNMSNDSPDVVAVELICDDETTCRLKLTPKAAGYADIMVSSSSCRENIRVTVSEKMGISANEVKMNVNGSNSIYLSVHNSLSQYEVETSLTRLDGSGNEVLTQYSMEEVPSSYSDFTKYEITFTAGDKAEELLFKAEVGGRSKTVPVYVGYNTYLSFTTIDPSNPGDDIVDAKALLMDISSSSNMTFNLYVEGGQEPLQEVLDKVRDAKNYKYEGTGSIMFGMPTVTSNTDGTYSVSVPVYAGSEIGDGVITLNVYGDELRTSVYIDDGKRYDRVYISFTRPNTYTIPPTEMTFITSKLVFSDESTFTIRVYHDISPDTRAKYIDWNITQSGDPVCIEVGREIDSNYTDFKYMISGVPGTAVINFNVYNPQGELGGIYAEYLNQTITATVTVADRESFLVNSVTFEFDFDNIETSVAAVPLEAAMDPVSSLVAWPIEYSIIEGADLADISQGTSGYQLNISKAGTIKVKAEAGPEGNKKSDILTVTAKLRLDQNATKPLEITNAPSTMYVGDNGTVTKLLHANYTVDESQYTWRSSRPDVIEVDAQGNILAKAEGKADIIVEIKDDYNSYASDQRTIEVKTLDISADLSTLPSDYYVVYDGNLEFWVDTESGSSDYYTFSLDTDILSSAGTHTAGVDFNGSVTFPNNKGATVCEITGGTIEVNLSNNTVTFNLTVAYGSATGTITGKITGSKPILVL